MGELEVGDGMAGDRLDNGVDVAGDLKQMRPSSDLHVAQPRVRHGDPPGRPAAANSTETRRCVLPSRSAIRSTAISLPSRMIPTLSQTRSTSSSSCEERKTAQPRSRSSRTSARNSSCISGSRPLVGSSKISSSGRWKRARISPIFWRFPRESSPSGRSRSARKRVGELLGAAGPSIAAQAREQRDRLVPAGRSAVAEVAGQVAEPGADRDAVALDVEAEEAGAAPRSGGAGRAGCGSSSSCRPRWVPGSRRPRPARPAA